jgi:hypothetical protein
MTETVESERANADEGTEPGRPSIEALVGAETMSGGMVELQIPMGEGTIESEIPSSGEAEISIGERSVKHQLRKGERSGSGTSLRKRFIGPEDIREFPKAVARQRNNAGRN